MQQGLMQQAIATHVTRAASTYKTFSEYAQDMQLRHRFLAICSAEQIAWDMGYILIPATCLSWRKRATLGDARRIKIHESFYALFTHELTDLERNKFFDYLDKLKGERNDCTSQ